MTLKFNPANSKLAKLYKNRRTKRLLAMVTPSGKVLQNVLKVYSFDLPAGHSCPSAHLCKSRVDIIDGKRKIVDGPNTVFRCYAASSEVRFPAIYNNRKLNFDALRAVVSLGKEGIARVINHDLPSDAGIVRIHTSGDFFTRDYFRAWLIVARQNPHVTFYAYTKQLKFWIDDMDTIPENFRLTASRGGTQDDLIDLHNLPEARVVYSKQEADDLGLEIDDDDSHACLQDGSTSFGLLIHGTQPKGSEAGKALQLLKSAK